MDISQIEMARLATRRDSRAADDSAVRSLATSISEIGIINPLRVRAKRVHVNGVEDDGFEIIAGAHRFRAALKLGLETLPCVVVADDDIDAEIAMIDENLSRAELSPADRAAQTARRKVLYEKKHPGTAHGVNQHDRSRQVGDSSERFTADAAAATGKSERAIQRDAERGEKISDRALQLVAGTDLDKGAYLDKLKKIETEDEQVSTVTRALAGLARAAEREKAEAHDKRNQSRIEADVKARAAKEVADIIAGCVPPDMWDGVKANLYAAGARNIADALNNVTGPAVMDRGAA